MKKYVNTLIYVLTCIVVLIGGLSFILDKVKYRHDIQLIGVISSSKCNPSIDSLQTGVKHEIKFFEAKITEKSDSLILKIYSYLRPEPLKFTRGDELILKGKFSIQVFSDSSSFYVNLNGYASSIKKNNKEFLPSVIITAYNWIVAFSTIIVVLVAIFGFIWGNIIGASYRK